MGYALKQSSAAVPLVFLLVSNTDHVTPVTGLGSAPVVTLSKTGGTFASPAGAISEIGNGWYQVAANATDSNTAGPLLLHATGTGADPLDDIYQVVNYDPYDAVHFGLSALPNVAAGANGGLPTGNASGQVVAASVAGAVGSVTGAVGSVTAAVTVGTNNDKAGYALTTAEHTAITNTDVPAALTAQGYTTARAVSVDNLDATVSSRNAVAPDNATISTINSNVSTLYTNLAIVNTNVSSRLAASAYVVPPAVAVDGSGYVRLQSGEHTAIGTEMAAAVLVTPGNKVATNSSGQVVSSSVVGAVVLPNPAPTGYGGSFDPATISVPEAIWDGTGTPSYANILTAIHGEVWGSENVGLDGTYTKETAGGTPMVAFAVTPPPTVAARRTRLAGTPVPVPAAATFVALGAWTPPGTVSPWDGSTAAHYQTTFGQPPAIINYYQDLVHSPAFNAAQATEITSHGGIPHISWELDDYTGNQTQSAYSNAALLAGAHDAAFITWLTAAATWNQPFLLRPMWEMSGFFYSWAAGCNGNTPGSYIDAWRHLANLVRAHAPKAQLVWCPSVDIPGAQLLPLEDCYPGSSYVDVLSLDGYNKYTAGNPGGVWWTFSQVFLPSYTRIAALDATKPIIISETGCQPDARRPAWIAAIPTALDAMPRIEGLVWFNNQVGALDCRLSADSPTLAAFQALAALPQMQGTWP